jgi:cellulose synthase/poly-beta-1,6-N-acetylglucosamine synthase-like glycosyltransferase
MKKIACLVPAYNEEKVIAQTLKAILRLIPSNDLYVVNDGSVDKTLKIAKKFTRNILTTQNCGKAHALNKGIKYFDLTKKYKYIFFMDADTHPKPDFLEKVFVHFNKNKEVFCVVGRVKGMGINLISKYRQWEYQVSHLIHKEAQQHLNSILVVPGCATVYRSFLFDKLEFPSGTLTEDMDFTFMLHRHGFNKIIFENKAIVYTQDPTNLTDFIKQINRWYSGFWQVVKKHNIPWQGQALDLEVAILALEGLYNGLIVILFMLFFFPLAISKNLVVFTAPLLIDLFAFFIPTLIWSSIADKDYARIIYIPQFYFLRFLSSIIFIKSLFNGYTSSEKNYIWDTRRYPLERR